MSRVIQLPNNKNKMFVYGVDFTEGDATYPFPGTGIQSQISWLSPQMQNAMRFLFNIGPNERIAAIEVDDEGIKAHVEYVVRGKR